MIRPVRTGSGRGQRDEDREPPVVDPRPGRTPTAVPTQDADATPRRFSKLRRGREAEHQVVETSASDSEQPGGTDVEGIRRRRRRRRRRRGTDAPARQPAASLHHGGDEHRQEEEGHEESRAAAPARTAATRATNTVTSWRARSWGVRPRCRCRRSRPGAVASVGPSSGDTMASSRGGPRGRRARRRPRERPPRRSTILRETVVVAGPVPAEGGDQFPAGDDHDQPADHPGHEPGPDAGLVLEESVVESHDERAEAEGGEQSVDDDLLDRDSPLGRGPGHPASTFLSCSSLPLRYSTKSSPAAELACR